MPAKNVLKEVPKRSIKDIINKLQNAKRPLIIAGQGIRLSKQQEIFSSLVKKLNIPICLTFNSFDILESNNKNYIGGIGTVGQRAGNFALQNADCILFLGTRKNIRQISYNWEIFAKNAYKIVVDIDKAELDKPTVVPNLKIHADLKDFLPKLLKDAKSLNKKGWLEGCQERKDKYSFYNTIEYQQKKANKSILFCT